MNQTMLKKVRILAIAPSARGFGFAVMENQVILESGNKGAKGNKNLHSLFKIERLMKLFQPGVLVLQDVNAQGFCRAPRIKALHQQIIELADKRKCRVVLFSGKQLRMTLLGNVKATKHEIAEMLAQNFPLELAGKLPAKRRAWENENGRMDIFDAVALAVVFRSKKTKKTD
jgi:Holliday junction resolvasome RuvABC endonuclease subunit